MLGILRSAEAELRMTAQYMSLVGASAASDAVIPAKAATDARDSSFRRSSLAFGHILVRQWANSNFNSTIHEMPTANWASRESGRGWV